MIARNLAFALFSSLPLLAQDPQFRWIPLSATQFEIDGLPWYGENGGELFRLPVARKDTYRKPVWDLAQQPSGGRVRFRTNSSALAIRLEYPGPPEMGHMHALGQSGGHLYADGADPGTAAPHEKDKPGETHEHQYSKNQPHAPGEIPLYLPLYSGVKVLGIGLDPDASIDHPKPFAVAKPVVFYGTSITQGGCASRGGMSYQAILGRLLNLD